VTASHKSYLSHGAAGGGGESQLVGAQTRDGVEGMDEEAKINFPKRLISRLEVRSAYH
jgi:hypothetical protein